MIIKNKKLVNEFIGMIVNVRGGEDGMVGLNEFMYDMYGRVEDVKMLKRDILNEYGIKIGVDEENEVVFVWGEGDDE